MTDIKALIKSGERNNELNLVKSRLHQLGFPVEDDGYANQKTLEVLEAVHTALKIPFTPENLDCYKLCPQIDNNAETLRETAKNLGKPPVAPEQKKQSEPTPSPSTEKSTPNPTELIEEHRPAYKRPAPFPPPVPTPPPVAAPAKSTPEDHDHTFGSVTKDIFVDAPVAAAKGTAKGIAIAGEATGKGVAYAVTHPIKTITTPFKKLFGLFGGGDDDDHHKLSESEMRQARRNPDYNLFKQNPQLSDPHFATRDAIVSALDPDSLTPEQRSSQQLPNRQSALQQKLIQAGYLSIHDVINKTDEAPMRDALRFIADKFKLNGRDAQETAAKMEAFFNHIDSPKKLEKALNDAAKHPEKTAGYINFDPVNLQTEHHAYLTAWKDSFHQHSQAFTSTRISWGGTATKANGNEPESAAKVISHNYDELLKTANMVRTNYLPSTSVTEVQARASFGNTPTQPNSGKLIT